MLKNKMKKYVCTVFQNNEHGFTFVSMLVTVAVLFITLPLLAYVVKSAGYSSNQNDLNLQQFFHFLQNEAAYATDYTISDDKIWLISPGETEDENHITALFEQYDDLVRRRVDGLGHEVYLRDVKKFEATSLPYGFHVNVLTLQGEYYEKTIVFDN